jgi:hypothetical protein
MVFGYTFKDIKEVTKKPLKMRASRDWSDEEVEQLKSLYNEFKDAVDPVNRIIDRMEVKRQKKRVVEKIMGNTFFGQIKLSHFLP